MAKTTTETRVEVARSGRWWAVKVPELPGTYSQAARLDQVEARAREAIALMLDVAPEAVGPLDIRVDLPSDVQEVLARVREARQASELARIGLSESQREAAAAMQAAGYPMRDIGRLLGLSHQRISQILAG